jgi:hypothetical protein
MEKKELPFDLNTAYLIRTVTYHILGRVKEIRGDFLVLQEASWVADSGRFGKAISEGQLSEVEFVGAAIVNVNAITDAYPWSHKLPDETK